MKRVVVTGLGVVSSIGNNAAEVTRSLRDGKSGIEFVPQYRELGFRSQVAGTLKMNVDELVDRRLRRFMGDGWFEAMGLADLQNGLHIPDPRDQLW